MKFQFIVNRYQGWYHFDENGKLHSTLSGDKYVPYAIEGKEIHKEYIEILNPIYDYYKDNNLTKKKTHQQHTEDVYKLLVENLELREAVQEKICNFANTYTINHSLCFEHLEYDLYGDEKPYGKSFHYTVYNLVAVAIRMTELLVTRNSYETVPLELKGICNKYGGSLKPQLNGGLYYEISDIFASMYWTMAFTEFQHKVKECKWCSAPLLTDIRASFCKAPRQCKNHYNNSKRPTKKGAK